MADSLPGAGGVPEPGRAAEPRHDVVGLVLAAGAGTRLAPLTHERPKALVPVGGIPLVEWALGRLAGAVAVSVVNVHHGRAAMESWADGRAVGSIADDGTVVWSGAGGAGVAREGPTPPGPLLSVEDHRALGTAGAVGRLRAWLDGRSVLAVNADAWVALAPGDRTPVDALLDGWDGERLRVLVHGADELGPRVSVVASLLPAGEAIRLEPTPSGLWERCWRQALAEGRLDSVRFAGGFLDTGTPATYLAANLAARAVLGVAGDGSLVGSGAMVDGSLTAAVVGAGARVHGGVDHSVVWDGAEVAASERLVRAVRTTAGRTVLVR